jgi:hypothetical protein
MVERIESRPSQRGNAVDRPVVLRKVMEALSANGFAEASLADLSKAAGVDRGTLQIQSTFPSDRTF